MLVPINYSQDQDFQNYIYVHFKCAISNQDDLKFSYSSHLKQEINLDIH